jgi:GTP cyclohydrolase I
MIELPEAIEMNVLEILDFITYMDGDANIPEEVLNNTPERVRKAYNHIFGGYNMTFSDIATVFENDSDYDQMVYMRDIEFYSMCEHHMIPFFGKATVAYIPKDKVIGASKLARLVDMYSRRLQIQERMTQQIVDALFEELQCVGAACHVEAEHLCMKMRGVEKQHSVMGTTALRGIFKTGTAKQEFLQLLRK